MNEEEMFHQALALSLPEERAAYLERVCAGDPALQKSIEALLRANVGASGFLLRPPPGLGAPIDQPIREGPGTVIGPYKLLEAIGEGGMGMVYMAEQTQPVRRKVALKIIKPGMDTRHVIARFEAERQALALMEHANIARVLDAGSTESGRPYFVMELVRGIPITEYCDGERLSIDERLDLFVLVCQAVQHAHQQGIIHRDIKPSNVLITLHDGTPVPKVIDFGIAKATGQQSLTDKTLFTGFAQLVGTPLYMSPEQAELSAVDIDTRSDIYSLGVLLYELLTGTTPFDQGTFRTAALDEVRRIIREDEPPTPSTRLRKDASKTSSRFRPSSFILHPSSFQELDWIVMKALEKDRRRRYDTASGLARDVERYLAGDPVEACPPSGWYRIRKFARRNGVVLTATVLVAFALIAGTTMSVWQAHLARRARAEAIVQRDEARQAVDDMYTDVAQEWLAHQAALAPMQKKFLEKALGYYERFAGDDKNEPSARLKTAVAYRRVAEIQEKLGHYSEAESACHRATRILERIAADGPSVPQYECELASSEGTLARLSWATGPHENAERLARRAIARLEKLVTDVPSEPRYRNELARSYMLLAQFLSKTARWEAEKAILQAIPLFEKLAADSLRMPRYRHELVVAHANLGLVLRDIGRHEDARRTYRRAITLGEELVSESPSVPEYVGALALSLDSLAQLSGSPNYSSDTEHLYRRAIELEEKLAADSPSVPSYRLRLAMTQMNLALILGNAGRWQEAEQVNRQAIALLEKLAADLPSAIDYQDVAD